MAFTEDLGLLLRARYPIVYVATAEEERAEAEIASCAKAQGDRAVYLWDFVDGYQGNLNDAGFGRRNPLQALELIEKLPAAAPAVFILRDFHRFLDDIAISRKLRNLGRLLKAQPKNIVILSPQLALPEELGETVTVLEFTLPSVEAIRREVDQLLGAMGMPLAPTMLDEVVRSCQGLSLERIRRVLGRAIASHGSFDERDLDLILEEKRQTIRQTQILDFYPATEQISDIGGLDNLKDWLLKRGTAFSEKARQYGLPYPRGLLLIGIQGTGKSLTAKAIAHHWHLPLLRLDVGRLFGGLVGESESRTRQMIQLAEALAPVCCGLTKLTKPLPESIAGAMAALPAASLAPSLPGWRRKPPPCLWWPPPTTSKPCRQKCCVGGASTKFSLSVCPTRPSGRPFSRFTYRVCGPTASKPTTLPVLPTKPPTFLGPKSSR